MFRCWPVWCLLFAVTMGAAVAADLVFWGPGYMDDARAVAIAPNGDVWVGCSGRIAIFAPDGTFKQYSPLRPGQVNSITFTPKGDPIIGINDGAFIVYTGEHGTAVSGFKQYAPWEVTLDEQGAVYGTDGGNNVIKKFDVSGMLPVLLTTYKASDAEAMERPFSLALDRQHRLYVSDERKPGLWVFNNDGTFVRRLLPETRCWRVRRGPDGNIYVVTNANLTVLAPETGTILREVKTPAGQHEAMGFTIDPQGNLYFGNFYGGLVRKTAPDGTPLLVMGPSYKATLKLPEAWTPGAAVACPFTVERIATHPLGKVPPVFSLALQPASLPGEADSNWANLQGQTPDPAWEAQRQAQYQAQEIPLHLQQEETTVTVTVPKETPTNLYRLLVHAEHDAPGGLTDRELAVRAVQPGITSGMTLYVPRQRSVFQQGETVEINVILRGKEPQPAGTLRFSLATRNGEELAYQAAATPWKTFPVAAMAAGTLTFRADAAGMHPGRYLLQAEYSAGDLTLRDTWPLQIVTAVAPTRFRILFPEWSAGYTDIWGPFTGKGMRADAAALAKEGILLYDTTIGGRNQDPALQPVGREGAQAPALMAQAAADPALPAPERFLAASPLEIELQEALRNGLTVQRDLWGSHFLDNWGYGTTLGIERDNRLPQLWTQWQREWPSWIGHRYLTLSLDEGDNPERVALKEQAKSLGLVPPDEGKELAWARNGVQRRFISDAPAPVEQEFAGIGADAAGNVYLASRGGTLLRYTPEGTLAWQGRIPGEVIDLAVAPDGTVYGAHMGLTVSVTTPDGKTITWHTPDFSSHSPRGICVEKGGTLLVSDEDNGRVCRFTADGKLVGVVADKRNLQRPAGLAVLSDGTIAVLDGGRNGVMLFKADGTPITFLAGVGSHSAGGKGDVCAAADDTLWVTQGWSLVEHYDLKGKRLGYVGRGTFALGGLSLPMSLAITPKGNILVSDVAMPFAQEFTPAGEPVRMLGLKSLVADVRIDRQRYTWADRIITTVWMPVEGQNGDPRATLQAFARQGNGQWQPLSVQGYAAGDYAVAVPKVNGETTLRLIWAPAGAGAEEPLHADFAIQVSERSFAEDQQKLENIFHRQLAWKEIWARTRMGTLVRWTQLSDRIRPGTQNTAPTNYGTPDSLAEGVWVPWRRDAVVAECENEGHDHGSFPLMGPWYIARALEGPGAKPVWSSLLAWYWNDEKHQQRATRDTVLLLGTGASGIGTGICTNRMNATQLALHRKMVDRLQRLGEATMALEYPGRDGVAVLHSFTQEAMDPYMEEHFYAAHAAWYDLLRAHVPTAVISEESIAKDGLKNRFKAVLLPFVQFPLPAATLAGLARFQQAGGEVWVDLGTRMLIPGAKLLKTRYRPFWAQDAYYWMHGGYGLGGYDGNYEYWRMRQGSDQRLPAIREAFGKYARIPVATADADIFLQQRQGGAATYVFASNDHFPQAPLHKTWLAGETPAPATATFTLPGGAVYDALAMQRVTGATLTVDFTNAEPARIWAVLPRPLAGVRLTAAQNGELLSATVQVNDAAGKALPAVIPVKLVITDGKGNAQYTLWRSTNVAGLCSVQVPVDWSAPQGTWTVTAQELLSGAAATPAKVAITARPPAALTQVTTPALVFDGKTISGWLATMKGNEVWIALDTDQQALRQEAAGLAETLQARGIKARVVNIAEVKEVPVWLSYKLTDEQQATLAQVRAGQLVGMRQLTEDFKVCGPQRVIMRPLILLGDPAQNRWLADIHRAQLVRRPLSPCYPGPGRALVQYVWAPFYDGFDAVAISATDVPGVRAGIQALSGL